MLREAGLRRLHSSPGSETIPVLRTSLSHQDPAAAMGVVNDADHSLSAFSVGNELSILSFTGSFGK